MAFQMNNMVRVWVSLFFAFEIIQRSGVMADDDSPVNGKCADDVILCSCSSRQITVRIRLERCPGTDPITQREMCRVCNDHLLRSDLCEHVENCRSCHNDGVKCVQCPPGEQDSFCYQMDNKPRRSAILQQLSPKANTHPQKLTIPKGQPLRSHPVLHSTGCDFPASLRTANVLCVLDLHKVNCVQSCVWGHTFPEGPARNATCRYKTGKWIPSPLEECKPFVNCNLKIATPGEMKCFTDPFKGPLCQLGCRSHGNKASVSTAVYTCLTNGEWKPTLPHCMEKDTSLDNVPEPSNVTKNKRGNDMGK